VANKSKKKANAEAKRLAAEKAARKAKLQWVAVIGVGVAIVAGFIIFSIIEAIPEDGDTTAATWDLPALANDPNGDGRLTLEEFRGKPVVLNFYADWCIACEDELPAFSAVSQELGDRVQFVHVNTQETGSWRRLVEEFGTDWWPIARDINGSGKNGSGLWQTLSGQGMPITAMYDARGNLVFNRTGTMSESLLRTQIADLFGIT
jgi:cytochrome c biogenesis protein CcmG, thiol:disulfide interchange protein DsbE